MDRRKSHTEQFPVSGQKRPHSLLSPSPSPNSPRRRPRGSDAGKSIHKAAEAPDSSHFRTGRIAVPGPSPLRTHVLPSLHHVPPFNSQRPATPDYKPQVARKSASKSNRAAKTATPSAGPRQTTPPMIARKTTLPRPKVRKTVYRAVKTASLSTRPRQTPPPAMTARKRTHPRSTTRKTVSISTNSAPKTARPRRQISTRKTRYPPTYASSDDSSNDSLSAHSSNPCPEPFFTLLRSDRFDAAPSDPTMSHSQRAEEDTNVHRPHDEKSKSPGSPRNSSLASASTPPPQPLIDAFENLFVYPLYLHRVNRLPFLLRNVRASFRAWCRDRRTSKPMTTILADTAGSCHVSLIYEYISPLGVVYTFETQHPQRECPLCAIFGVFDCWEDLKRHVKWDHGEIACELFSEGDEIKLVVRLDGHDVRVVSENKTKPTSPIADRALTFLQSLNIPRVSHATPDPPPPVATATDENDDDIDVASLHITMPPRSSSSRQILPPASPRSRPPTPPPLSDPHGAARPIIATDMTTIYRDDDDDETLLSLRARQPTTYRPTGPHLYDHLSELPLDGFGQQKWFVLDKEEEIFELVDVMDEDKVICALWGRWILFNRQFFIANYLAGVEAFVDEYWLVIHRAAGWGALRAWLMVLVSRRFLKNIELVQVLKKYNALVGKE